jgi:hypothetical protein
MSLPPELSALLPCAVLVPTLGRPHRLEAVVANIRRTTPEDHVILACAGDPESLAVFKKLDVFCIDDTDYSDKRYVTRMNALAVWAKNTGAKTMFFGSDDVIHHHGWLSNALEVMAGEGEPAVVVVNDMHNPNGTQAVMRADYLDRAVFDSPGMAFHSEYMHQYADTEQFATAQARQTFARAMTSCVEHLHPTWKAPNALPVDETYKAAQTWKVWQHDSALFKERLAQIESMFGLKAQAQV